jgi:hypothetical protein
MENTEQKTPEQWFQQLKEPYRSEAIANIDVNRSNYENYPKSFYGALYNSFDWYYSKQGRDYWYEIQVSVQAGETTYLETELKPQDMISGEWYVIDCGVGEWLEKFKELVGNKIYSYHSFDLDCFKYSKSGLHIGYSEGDKIRKATRKEVLEHFPDEFQEEKKIPYSIYQPLFDLMCEQHNARLIDSEMQEVVSVCEKILESRKENEIETYFWTDGVYHYPTKDIDLAIENARPESLVYRATPIGTKQTKSILEPIKPNN